MLSQLKEFLTLNDIEFCTLHEQSRESLLVKNKGVILTPVPLGSSPILQDDGRERISIFQDRWYGDTKMKIRLLARLGRFRSIFARKCTLLTAEKFITLFKSNKIPQSFLEELYTAFPNYRTAVKEMRTVGKREEATLMNLFNSMVSSFLDENHSYGNAKCRYRIALFYGWEMVAAATFSGALKMTREREGIPSYEWVRYASLPDVRISGGMGRVLGEFRRILKDEGRVQYEIMTYSDNEWSLGDAYKKLGFEYVGSRKAVQYYVDPLTWRRYNLRQAAQVADDLSRNFVKIENCGSRKFLLRID